LGCPSAANITVTFAAALQTARDMTQRGAVTLWRGDWEPFIGPGMWRSRKNADQITLLAMCVQTFTLDP